MYSFSAAKGYHCQHRGASVILLAPCPDNNIGGKNRSEHENITDSANGGPVPVIGLRTGN
jgi:hypothetical protein